MLCRIGLGACGLDLPPSSKIHPVIHVSQLGIYNGSNHLSDFLPIPLDLEAEANEKKNMSHNTREHSSKEMVEDDTCVTKKLFKANDELGFLQ